AIHQELPAQHWPLPFEISGIRAGAIVILQAVEELADFGRRNWSWKLTGWIDVSLREHVHQRSIHVRPGKAVRSLSHEIGIGGNRYPSRPVLEIQACVVNVCGDYR